MIQTVHQGIPTNLLQLLEVRLADAGDALLVLDDLARMLPPRSPSAVRLLVCRAVDQGVLLRIAPGVYLAAAAYDENPFPVLCRLVGVLRPDAFSYISLEAAARGVYDAVAESEANLTVMTTGRSARIVCVGFGTLELVHTKRPVDTLRAGTRSEVGCLLPIASRELLDQDLKATKRLASFPTGLQPEILQRPRSDREPAA